MKSASIRHNFIYKSIHNLSSYVIAFVTYPYVSRVLGVDNIGAVGFVDNTVGFFLLFATMGVAILGTREVAAVRNDREQLSRAYSSILGMNVILTLVTLAAYICAVLFIPNFSAENGEADRTLLWIGAAKIIATAFIVEWFYAGLENFRYITVRNIVIKLLYIAAVFIFVRQSSDYIAYFALTVGVVVLNALINSVYALSLVNIRLRELFSTKYIKENFTLGIYTIMTSMYLTFNVMYLGIVSCDQQVGAYTTAFKLYTIILGLCSAFTGVMMPRMSALLAQGQHEEFKRAIGRSFEIILRFIVPIAICSTILAPHIIGVLSGAGYEEAILPMRIIMPATIFVGIAQVLAIQILTPMRCDKILLCASICGGTMALILNLLIVAPLKSVGSAIVMLSSEGLVTAIYLVYALRKRMIAIPFRAVVTSLASSIPPAAVSLCCLYFITNPFVSVVVAVTVGGLSWGALNLRFIRKTLLSK